MKNIIKVWLAAAWLLTLTVARGWAAAEPLQEDLASLRQLAEFHAEQDGVRMKFNHRRLLRFQKKDWVNDSGEEFLLPWGESLQVVGHHSGWSFSPLAWPFRQHGFYVEYSFSAALFGGGESHATAVLVAAPETRRVAVMAPDVGRAAAFLDQESPAWNHERNPINGLREVAQDGFFQKLQAGDVIGPLTLAGVYHSWLNVRWAADTAAAERNINGRPVTDSEAAAVETMRVQLALVEPLYSSLPKQRKKFREMYADGVRERLGKQKFWLHIKQVTAAGMGEVMAIVRVGSESGHWLQGDMAGYGHAAVSRRNPVLMVSAEDDMWRDTLLRGEGQAMESKRGIWGEKAQLLESAEEREARRMLSGEPKHLEEQLAFFMKEKPVALLVKAEGQHPMALTIGIDDEGVSGEIIRLDGVLTGIKTLAGKAPELGVIKAEVMASSRWEGDYDYCRLAALRRHPGKEGSKVFLAIGQQGQPIEDFVFIGPLDDEAQQRAVRYCEQHPLTVSDK